MGCEMMDDQELKITLTEMLNKGLRLEHGARLQYLSHVEMVSGIMSEPVVVRLKEIAEDERKHEEIFRDLIGGYLGGIPTMGLEDTHKAGDLKNMLEVNLKDEKDAILRDGNDGKWKSGYDALDIVGVNRDRNDISILPMHSQLHSKAIDVDTMKNMLFDRILDIIVYSNNRGVFVFDRQFDDRKVIKELHTHKASYIIRMKNNRDVYYNSKKQNINELARSTKLCYRFKVSDEATISAGICPVEILLNPHPVKTPTMAKAVLVVAKIKSNRKDNSIRSGLFYFLCNINRDDLPKREVVRFILDAYKLRWKIEEVHRHVKTDYGWESIQLQTYRRLQNMNTILWVAISFLYSLDSWKFQLSKVFSHIMTERKKISELECFIYYRLAEVLKYCFNKINLYRKITYQKGNPELLQLRVSWI